MKTAGEKKRVFLYFFALMSAALLLFSACSLNPRARTETSVDAEFEKFSLILTDEEIDIYKHLPEEAKKEFLEECWKVRDPDPATEENEARIEFEERVQFANRWFGPISGDRLSDKPEAQKRDAGWFTDRGRIYIILGPPDRMFFVEEGDFRMLEHNNFADRWKYDQSAEEEVWDYDRYKMAVHFYKSYGRWLLEATPDLNSLIRDIKLNYIGTANLPGKSRLRFESEYLDHQLILRIPAKRINFLSEEENLKVIFRIHLRIYRDYQKQAEKTLTREIKLDEEKLLQTKEITLEVPVEGLASGTYLLDVVVEDITSGEVFDRYRRLVKVRVTDLNRDTL